MGRNAPPPPPHWAFFRAENAAVRQADPADIPDRSPSLASGRFEVVGRKEVFGFAPGEVLEIDLTDGQAKALVEAGHIAPVVPRANEPVIKEA